MATDVELSVDDGGGWLTADLHLSTRAIATGEIEDRRPTFTVDR
jgi:hypothetical protein